MEMAIMLMNAFNLYHVKLEFFWVINWTIHLVNEKSS